MHMPDPRQIFTNYLCTSKGLAVGSHEGGLKCCTPCVTVSMRGKLIDAEQPSCYKGQP